VREIGENNERHLNEPRQRAVKDLRKSDTLKTTSASFDSTKHKNNDGKLAAVPTMSDTSLGVLGVGEVASGEGARGGADGINLRQQQVVCSFWGVERLDLPHEWRYKGHLAKRISDTVFSGNVVAGNLSYLMSKELQMRKAVDRVCGTDAARLPPAPATRPSTPTYREKEVRDSKTGKGSGANLEVYQDLLRQHTQVEQLAYNVGFECVAAGLQRSLACASAALGLPIHSLQHWQQASIEGRKEGDTRAQVRALLGQAEVLCRCSKFEEAHACLEQALALVRKANGAAEEEDILCVERAHVQVHDLRVLEGLQSAEQAYVAGNVHKALQGYSVAGDTAARALILVLSVSDKEQRLAVKREAARGKRAKDKEIVMGKDGSKSLPPAIRPRRIFLEEEDGGDTPGSHLPQTGGKDSDYYRENVAAQVHDYNSTQLSKIQRRLARNRYKALAASACCMMKVGDMSSALAAWHQVFKASEVRRAK
jgi:tetratricopeptide (TPR) repeat protein